MYQHLASDHKKIFSLIPSLVDSAVIYRQVGTVYDMGLKLQDGKKCSECLKPSLTWRVVLSKPFVLSTCPFGFLDIYVIPTCTHIFKSGVEVWLKLKETNFVQLELHNRAQLYNLGLE